MSLERLRRLGVALLAPRSSVLGHDPCGGSEVLFWEDFAILEEHGIPVRAYGRDAVNSAPVRKLPLRTSARLITSMEYCGQFLWHERAATVISYNEPTVAGLAPRRSLIRFDWATALPQYWKVPGWRRRFERSRYLFPSYAERDGFLAEHRGMPETSTVVLPNAVDRETFKPSAPIHAARIGFAGQWVPRKGVNVLLDAWAEVKKRQPEAELWLAGGADLWKASHTPEGAEQIAARVRQLEAQQQAQLWGSRPRKDMPEFWQSVAVAVVPSLYEPFGLVALEAMACGVPVVASKVGGLPEIVLHQETGLLVPPDDPRALAAALLALLSSFDLRRRMSEAARRRTVHFSLEHRAAGLLRLLEQVSEGQP